MKANIKLEVPYRSNQKDWKPVFSPFAKARKRVETLFCTIMRSIYDNQKLRKTNRRIVYQNYGENECTYNPSIHKQD